MAVSIPVNNLAYPTLASNGTTASWVNMTPTFNDGAGAVMTIPHGSKTVQINKDATLEVKGNVVINGVDLEERLNVIEQVLNIPHRDVTMETKYPKLAKLYQQYMHELEKYKTFERLKGDDNERTTP